MKKEEKEEEEGEREREVRGHDASVLFFSFFAARLVGHWSGTQGCRRVRSRRRSELLGHKTKQKQSETERKMADAATAEENKRRSPGARPGRRHVRPPT